MVTDKEWWCRLDSKAAGAASADKERWGGRGFRN